MRRHSHGRWSLEPFFMGNRHAVRPWMQASDMDLQVQTRDA